MNKKILVVSILTAFILITISFTSTVSSNTETNDDKKESPLYKIRTNRAIGKNLGKILENIKAKFFGERIFFLPFQWLRNKNNLPIGDGVVMASLSSKCSTHHPLVFTCGLGGC